MALEPESDLWAQIRYAYEDTDQPVGDICVEHGISSGTLRDRMRRWHWKRRRPPIPHAGPPSSVAAMQQHHPTPAGFRCRSKRRPSPSKRGRGRRSDG